MKKMYFESLPKWGNGRYKGKFNWTESIGYEVEFIYNNLKGSVKIIDYEKGKNMLTIKYLDSEFKIDTRGFRKCTLGELLKVKTVDYRYALGSVVNNMKLLEQKRMRRRDHTEKGYTYHCLECGYIGEMYEYQITANVGCQACANRIIVKGLNDIATTNPEYIKYFVDINDAYKYSRSANRKIRVKCPDCGHKKQMTINTLTNTGFSCNKCGDGISYPEKFTLNLLEQLNLTFETRRRFDWSKGKEYDFYISSLNMIIETHGLQHYEESYIRMKNNKRSLKEEKENDRFKEELAKENGIKYYVVLDCRESSVEWIRKSIINSEINKLFNLDEIKWDECALIANSSRLKKACELWNEGLGTAKISELLKINQGTVINYLHKGTKLNLCNYINVKKPRIVIVYDLNQKELGVFDSINQLARESEKYFGVKLSTGAISNVCHGVGKTYKGFKFAFKECYQSI